MAQSLNSKVDFTAKASSFAGLSTYGNVMVGNKAFEFYNERNPEDYIQIPWELVDHVSAEVLRGSKKIVRFAFFTTDGAKLSFSTRDNKACLRACRTYLGDEKLLRSPDFVEVVGRGAKSIPGAIKGLFHKDK